MKHTPDTSLHYVVGFSGGKDSVATALYLQRELELPRVTLTFADTGHESSKFCGQMGEPCPCLNCYLDLLERDHGFRIVRIQPILEDFRGELKAHKIRERIGYNPTGDAWLEKHSPLWRQPLDMERLAILKRRFASPMVRFCTTHLKLFPQRRWMRENCDMSESVRVSGVRAEESQARAKRSTYCQDDFFGCCLWLPIHKWTHGQVFDLHRKHGVPINPMYKRGCGRVGCFPCLFAKKEEIAAIDRLAPVAMPQLKQMEVRVAAAARGDGVMSFFDNYKTPKRFHSHTDPATGETFPDAEDVRRWARGELPASSSQLEFAAFEEDWTEDADMCRSQYGLCE